jgi:hypothetical protein
MTKLRTLAGAACAYAGVIALAGTALADTTVTANLGPIPIPNVPAQICITQSDVPGGVNECVTTPPGQSVSLTIVVHVETPEVVIAPPAVTPIPCPAGTQGVAAKVFTGSAEASIGGSVTVVLNGRVPLTIPIEEVIAAAGQTLTVYACAGVTPGLTVPTLPAL